LLPAVLSANEILDYLKRYEGRWVGEFVIYSEATNFRNTFSVEQRYWMEGGELRGISVAETNHGVQLAQSRAFFDGETLRVEVTQNEQVESYIGVLHDGGLVWVPDDIKRVTDYQMKESFVEKDGAEWLHTEGFDTFVFREGLGYLIYRGRLERRPEEI
jgi:hypothetical protein